MSRIKSEKIPLQCILTDEEKLRYGEELSHHISQLKQSEDSLKSFKAQVNGEIETHQAQINVLSEKIGSGKEFRPVECRVDYDFDAKKRYWIRTDTGEVIKEDVIPEADLQEEMELRAKDPIGRLNELEANLMELRAKEETGKGKKK